jgi:hypothetical protein
MRTPPRQETDFRKKIFSLVFQYKTPNQLKIVARMERTRRSASGITEDHFDDRPNSRRGSRNANAGNGRRVDRS